MARASLRASFLKKGFKPGAGGGERDWSPLVHWLSTLAAARAPTPVSSAHTGSSWGQPQVLVTLANSLSPAALFITRRFTSHVLCRCVWAVRVCVGVGRCNGLWENQACEVLLGSRRLSSVTGEAEAGGSDAQGLLQLYTSFWPAWAT